VHTEKWQARSVLWLATLSLAGIVGCPPPREGILPPVSDDAPAHVVIERVNQNARSMDFLMRAGGVSASGKLVGASGKRESFDAVGTLYYRRPRNLYMELSHVLAGKIEVGSNDREFWYWERLDEPRYYTGHHAAMAQAWETEVPLRPDHLLDMLGLRELPAEAGGPGGPTFAVGEEHYFLNFFDRGPDGNVFQSKTVAIGRRPPFLVSRVTYYNPSGKPWMRAELKDYRPIEDTAVLAPRRIEIRSLEDQSWINLEFSNVRPSDNPRVEQERILRSPLERGEKVGEIIRLDRPS